MIDWIKENSIAFAIATILHLLFIGALLFNWEFDKPEKIVLEQGDIIQATSVDANSYEAEIKKIEQQKQAERNRKAQAERKARELKEKKKQEEIRRKQEKKRQAEEQERKKAAEVKKKEEQRKAALLEKKRLEEKKLKEEKLKEEKLKEQKRKEAEKKRQAEEKRKKDEAKRKEEARQKAEQEKKRQEAERKRKAEEEKKRQAELQRRQEREKAEWERKSKGIINRHVALIAQKIERNWRQPLDAPSNLQCKIDIVLRPSGDVVSVKVVESSGSQSFDRSVETAVRKASPLPVPTNNAIFKKFEVMRLRFEPGSF